MTTNKINLLLIEDDFLIGERLYNTAKDLQNINKINLSVNLEEAKTMLMLTDYDFIVLDLNLPDGNGIELLKWLKEKKKPVKVFIFSINIELKRICLKNGAEAFFDKSQDFDALIDTLKKL
ncbi:MAG: response regulator [Flavobacteriales bacterium]